jgi:hypothetical protein
MNNEALLDLIGGHLAVELGVVLDRQLQWVLAAGASPQQAIDDRQAGVIIVGVVLLGGRASTLSM